MFQDIQPHILHNQYKNRKPGKNDYLIAYRNDQVLMYNLPDRIFPSMEDVCKLYDMDVAQSIHLLDVDKKGFFFLPISPPEISNMKYENIHILRQKSPSWLSFGGATAIQLARWYTNNKFCGKCASQLLHSEKERALYCPECGLVNYPKISPVIIVAITNGNELLMTRYAHAEYKKYSLVAGFMEIGETLEDTLRREVMEEVGLKVKNIRYYKSQPWAFSDSILAGFFAEVDGNTEIRIDKEELAEAAWFSRDKIPADGSPLSLTWDMIECFRDGKEGEF